MDELIIGEAGIQIQQIAETLEHSDSSFAVLSKNWKKFARNLGIAETNVLELENECVRGSERLSGIPYQIIMKWKAKSGRNATLRVLYDALVDCGCNDIAEKLKLRYCAHFYRRLKFKIHEDEATLEQLLITGSEKIFKQIYDGVKKDSKYGHPYQPVKLFRDKIHAPERPSYYVQRTLSHNTEIDQSALLDPSMTDHLFLVENITKQELAKLLGYKPVDVSGNQRRTINVQHMVLEYEEDFDEISSKTAKPVHKLRYDCGSFFWNRSSSHAHALQGFVKDNGIKLEESDLIKSISTLTRPSAFCISDSPGMGKSLLLASIARLLEATSAGKRVIQIYIVLNELAQHMKKEIQSIDEAVKLLADFSCICKGSKLLMETMLNEGLYVDLFLDGYDEVNLDKLNLVDQFLNHVRKRSGIRLFITTRTHLRRKLENILGVISFEILQFTRENQVEFLTKYWSEKAAIDIKCIKDHTQSFLETLHEKMKDTRREIAGIPLQCKLIADVYMSDAIRCSNLKQTSLNITVSIESVFDMYKHLIESKFSSIQKRQNTWASKPLRMIKYNFQKNCLKAHIYGAILLLFPAWLKRFESYLKGHKNVDENSLYSIGLMEKSPYTNMPRFVHRTFAEYILADFLMRKINKISECREFLFRVIFGKSGLEKSIWRRRPAIFKMHYPVIAYFVDHFMQSESGNVVQAMISSLKNKASSNEDLCAALVGSCCENLEACFSSFGKVISTINKSDETWDSLKQEYLKCLPHISAERRNSHALIKNLLTLMRKEFESNLNYYIYSPLESDLKMHFEQLRSIDFYRYPWIRNTTPLHVSIYNGSYNTTSYLIKEYAENLKHFKNLMHVCVRDSFKNSKGIIEEKILIMDLILEIGRTFDVDWLEEEFENTGCTPILQNNIDFNLVQHMVQLGANINAHSSKHGNILHVISSLNTDFINWAFLNGFSLINHQNSDGLTPLHNAIEKLDSVDKDIVAKFKEHGADFNVVDNHGNCLLFSSLKTGSHVIINEILKNGANVNYITQNKDTAAHRLMDLASKKEWSSQTVIGFLTLLMSNGFSLLDLPNTYGKTALHLAMELKELDESLLDFFYKKGANFNAEDAEGNSVFFYAVMYANTAKIFQKLIEFGSDLYHKNQMKQTALHIAAEYGNGVAFLLLAENNTFLFKPDMNNNWPAHLLFRTATNNNRIILTNNQILRGFDAKNKNGRIPLEEWINNGKYTLPILMECKNLLKLTPEIASKALTALVFDEEVLLFYFVAQREKDNILIEFYKFLTDEGGVILGNDGKRFEVNRLNQNQLLALNEIVLSTKFVNYANSLLSSGCIKPLSIRVGDLLAEHNFKIDKLLLYLLENRMVRPFLAICKTLFVPNEGTDCTPVERCNWMRHSVRIKKIPDENSTVDEICKCSLDFIPNCTPLHVATYYGNYNVTKELIEQHKDLVLSLRYVIHACVRDSAHNNETVIEHKRKIIRLLAEENSAWLEEKLEGSPPLLQPAVHFKLLQEIVTHGADISTCCTSGRTVLFQTECGKPFFELIQWAISNGFYKINQSENKRGHTALIHSIEVNGVLQDDVLREFADAGADFNAVCKQGLSVLFYCLKSSSIDFARRILAYGANINYQQPDKCNVAHHVLRRAYLNMLDSTKTLGMLKFLLSQGFMSFNQANVDGETPLHYAMRLENLTVELLKFFYENGADFNAVDRNGHSVLFFAIEHNQNQECISQALDYQANVNHQDSEGYTAAHVLILNAVKRNYDTTELISKLSLLISRGFVLINKPTTDGSTPLHWVMELKNLNVELLEFFHDNKSDFNSRDDLGDSVLFKAIRFGQTREVLQKLVEYRCNLNYRTDDDISALHVAAHSGNLEAVKFLIEKLDVNNKDVYGNTALHYLFSDENTDYTELLRLFLKHGSNFFETNMNQCVPFVRWVSRGKNPLPTLLELKGELPVTRDIASKALSLLIRREELVQKYLLYSQPEETQIFSKFVNFLLTKKPCFYWIENNVGYEFDWRKINKERIQNILVDPRRMQRIKQILPEVENIKIYTPGVTLLDLIEYSNITIETMFSTLLTCEMFKEFYQLCQILYSNKPTEIETISTLEDIDKMITLPGMPCCTTLHRAIFLGDYTLTKYLVETLGREEVKKMKYLMHACVENTALSASNIQEKIQIMALLLDINQKWAEEDLNGRPLLLQAVDIELIKYLVRNGVNINAFTEDHGTILHFPYTTKDIHELADFVCWCFKNGFDLVNHKNRSGQTPLLHLFSVYGTVMEDGIKILKMFLKKGADINVIDNFGNTLLFYGLKNCNYTLVKILLEFGADVHFKTQMHETAAHAVLVSENPRTLCSDAVLQKLSLLCENGFTLINHADCNGMTPLHYALRNVKEVSRDLLTFFENQDADFNSVDSLGFSILFQAIRYKQSDFVLARLTKAGANVDHLSQKNKNALHVAAMYRNVSAMEYAFDHIDANSKDIDGYTPLHCLFSSNEPVGMELVDIFDQNCANFNAVDKLTERSALFYAIMSNQNEMVLSRLERYGGNIFQLDHERNTILHVATMTGNQSALKYFLPKFRVKSAKNVYGDTPLHLLFSEPNKDYTNLLQLFLDAGADFNIKNMNGYIPLVKWILEGENPFRTLVLLRHKLPLTTEIAGVALTKILSQPYLLKRYLQNKETSHESTEQFVQFVLFLIKCGAHIQSVDGYLSGGKNFTEKNFENMNNVALKSGKFIKYLMENCKCAANSPLTFTFLFNQAKISLETVLDGLLVSREYDTVLSLCKIIRRIWFYKKFD